MSKSNIKERYILIAEDKEMDSDTLQRWVKPSGFSILKPITKISEAKKIISENHNMVAVSIIDLKLPNEDHNLMKDPNQGLLLAEYLHSCNIPVIIVSAGIYQNALEVCIKNKWSYLHKDELNESITIIAIEAIINKCVIYTESICNEIHRIIQFSKLTDPLEGLEWEILKYRRDGMIISDIAEKLSFSEASIRQKSSQILKKIGVNNVLEAARWLDLNAKKFGHHDLLDDKGEEIN